MRPFIVHLIGLVVLHGGTGIDLERITSEYDSPPEDKRSIDFTYDPMPGTADNDRTKHTIMIYTRKPWTPNAVSSHNTPKIKKKEPLPGRKKLGYRKKSGRKNSGITKELLSLAGINIVLGVACLLLSIAILAYYRKDSRSLVPVLYFRNGLTDLFCGIGVLIQCLALFCLTSEAVSHVTIPVLISYIGYIVTTVAIRMSVFMNCVLGVVRCIKIVKPFYAVNKTAVTISTLIYLAIWILIVAADFWGYITTVGIENKVYLVKSLVLKPEPGYSHSLSQLEAISVTYSIPVALPALLCFVMMLIQIYHLLYLRKQPTRPSNSNAVQPNSSRTAQNQKSAITILILTIIFVVTSTVSIVVWLVVYRDNLRTRDRIQILSWTELLVIYFSHSTCPLLCSTLTPLTLFVRCTAMRTAVTQLAHSRSTNLPHSSKKSTDQALQMSLQPLTLTNAQMRNNMAP